jgi:hypothetical protein
MNRLLQILKDVKFAIRRNIKYGEFWQVYQVYGISDNVYRFENHKLKVVGKVGFMEVDDKNIKQYYPNIVESVNTFGNLLVVETSHGFHFITFTIMDKKWWKDVWLKIWDVETNYFLEWNKGNVLRISPKQEPIRRWNFYIKEDKIKYALSLGHLAVYKLAKAITVEEMDRLEKYWIPTKCQPVKYWTKGEI